MFVRRSFQHLGIDIFRVLEAFTVRPNAIEFFAVLAEPTSVIKSVIWVTQTVLGDAFVIYRAYIVWGHNRWVVLFPICCSMGTAIAGYGACAAFARSTPNTSVFAITNWITSLFSLSLSTNIICTSLVAFRIWSTHRRVKDYGATNLWPVMIIVIESGAIYSAGLISLLVTYAVGSNGQYPALDAELPLVGIAFNLIIVRVGLGLAQNSSMGGAISSRGASSRRVANSANRLTMPKITTSSHQVEDSYPLERLDLERGVSVKVTKTHHEDSASNKSTEPDSKWTPV